MKVAQIHIFSVADRLSLLHRVHGTSGEAQTHSGRVATVRETDELLRRHGHFQSGLALRHVASGPAVFVTDPLPPCIPPCKGGTESMVQRTSVSVDSFHSEPLP